MGKVATEEHCHLSGEGGLYMSVYSSHQKSHSRATKKFSEVFQSHSVLMHRLLTPPPSAHTAFRQPTPGVHFSRTKQAAFFGGAAFPTPTDARAKSEGTGGSADVVPHLRPQCCTYPEAGMALWRRGCCCPGFPLAPRSARSLSPVLGCPGTPEKAGCSLPAGLAPPPAPL